MTTRPDAEKLARDLLDWEEQFGPITKDNCAVVEVSPEDWVRWVLRARRILAPKKTSR